MERDFRYLREKHGDAGARDFKVKSWTLCLPCELTIKEFQWWSDWSNQIKKLHGLHISLYESHWHIQYSV